MLVKNRFLILSLLMCATQSYASDPCLGPTALIDIVNRPTVSDSACTSPVNKVLLEAGFQYQAMQHAYQEVLPEAQFRIGITPDLEINTFLSNYTHQSSTPKNGFSTTSLAVKDRLFYNDTWITTIEGIVILPSGSDAYGSQYAGGTVNGIISYNIHPKWNFSFMFGVTNQSTSHDAGGQRYTSVNPDGVLTYSVTDHLDVYLEAYGQSRTAPAEGSGFNADGGLIYLVTPKLTIDVEAGQRISGQLQGFNHYLGAGFAYIF